MQIEFEAKFFVKLPQFYTVLQQCGAQKIKEKRLMKRVLFKNPKLIHSMFRVRHEGADRVTLSYKTYDPSKTIDSVQELELVIDNFDKGCQMLAILGLQKIRYVENYRETYKIDDCEVMIDWWPVLEPFVEIEGTSQKSVEMVAKKLYFSMNDARYGPTALMYQDVYGVSREQFEQISELTFQKIPELLRCKR